MTGNPTNTVTDSQEGSAISDSKRDALFSGCPGLIGSVYAASAD
jgi:hypothetical protein